MLRFQLQLFTLLNLGLTLYATDSKLKEAFSKCCKLGFDAAFEGNCTLTGPVSDIEPEHQSVCLSTVELCCARKLREMDCKEGIYFAREGQECSSRRHINCDEEHCCEACKLGLITGSMGNECSLQTISFGTLWDNAYQTCCSSTDKQELQKPVDIGVPENMCDVLPGELCAHICHPLPGSYRCECNPGFVLLSDGKSCEQNEMIDKCKTEENRCTHVCTTVGENIQCSCYDGYTLSSDGVTCLRSFAVNVQRCDPGYRYNFTTRLCLDINECEEENNCNPNTEDCFNSDGSYRCSPKQQSLHLGRNCRRGYRFNPSAGGCVDIDECTETVPCDSTQNCINNEGSYNCICRSGFQLDPLTLGCIDINECQINSDNCRSGERCDNTVGSFNCVRFLNCGTGYTYNAATDKCEDDDECALGIHNCDVNGAGWECKNTQGSFRCVKKVGAQSQQCQGRSCSSSRYTCPKGYRSHGGSMCIDINECEEGSHNCQSNEICVNTPSGYSCNRVIDCDIGFKLSPDKTRCIDEDECSEQPGLCSHTCINLYGSFTCGCNPGYKLDTDNRTCIDEDECEQQSRRLCAGLCTNQLGSYSCECPSGYTLSSDKFSCEDIDECRQEGICQGRDEICLNMRGSYKCTQISCPPGYEKDQNRQNRCKRINTKCQETDKECRWQPLSYTMHFITITSNMTIPGSGLDVFSLRGPMYSSTTVNFKLDVTEAIAPPNVRPANRSNFRLLVTGFNQATLSLISPIEGPQDVILKITMTFFNNGMFGGTTVSNIEIYVSQYSF